MVGMDPALVLVPGAGGQAWYWHRLVPELARRGLAAVPVDLPADDDSAGLDAYVAAVLATAAPWEDVFFHDVPPGVLADARNRGEPGQSSRPFEDPWPLPAWPDVPTLVLTGAE